MEISILLLFKEIIPFGNQSLLIFLNAPLVIFFGCLRKSLSYAQISSKPIGVCSCDNDGYINCSKRILSKEVYPGDAITLSLVTVGMCGNISPGVLLTESNGVDVTLIEDSQKTKIFCRNFTYILKDTYASHISLITI